MKKYKAFLSDKNPCVKIVLTTGEEIEFQVFPEVAPITVENFLSLVGKKFYNGLNFHRVVKGFIIQTGDPTGTGNGGSLEKIKGEFSSNGVKNLLTHTRGVVSMGRRPSIPNSASSQFFIVVEDSDFLDGEYAAFGYVTKGMDVVERISEISTDNNEKPLTPVTIRTIERLN